MFDIILNLIFPQKCIFCGDILDYRKDIGICDTCFNKVQFKKSICNGNAGLLFSSFCDEITAVFDYSGIVRQSVIRFKFFDKPSYHKAFARMLSDKIKEMTNFKRFDIIISVPLHKKREKSRGYNQSQLLVKELCRETGLPDGRGLLQRVRDTGSQRLLVRNARQANVKNAFMVTDEKRVKDKIILLVDDILTTGNTVDECARTLKEAGAKAVAAAVIATGRKF